jgi:hypothetical protein
MSSAFVTSKTNDKPYIAFQDVTHMSEIWRVWRKILALTFFNLIYLELFEKNRYSKFKVLKRSVSV